MQFAALHEIRVLGNDHKAMVPGVLPNQGVRRAVHGHQPNMSRLRKDIRQPCRQPMTEILIEQ
jgi:hypothetical protein